MLTSQSRQTDFPALGNMTYLNTAAESIPPACVHDALEQYWADKCKGMRGRDDHFETFAQCQEVAARAINLAAEEVSFCSCSSEAYNLLAMALELQAGDEVVVTDLDFPAGATPWLAPNSGIVLRLWKSRGGALDRDDLLPLLNEKTKLVQVSLVSFLNGFRLPWDGLVATIRERSPAAMISVDVTQALGRVEVDCSDADCIISSTHKWIMGTHGGCVVGIPKQSAERLTSNAGGWYHISNAFDADRFERTVSKQGSASFSVGMPNFAAIYALNAALRYLESVGVNKIAAYADPLIQRLHDGMETLNVNSMAPRKVAGECSGIVAFQHAEAKQIHMAMEDANIHIMHQAGRLRMALHGYNTADDVDRFLEVLGKNVSK